MVVSNYYITSGIIRLARWLWCNFRALVCYGELIILIILTFAENLKAILFAQTAVISYKKIYFVSQKIRECLFLSFNENDKEEIHSMLQMNALKSHPLLEEFQQNAHLAPAIIHATN